MKRADDSPLLNQSCRGASRSAQNLPSTIFRKNIRLKGYDYSSAGLYFVTLCTQDHLCQFGEIKDGEMILNHFGVIVKESWEWLFKQYKYIKMDAFVVMPNHFHALLEKVGDETEEGASRSAPTGMRVKRKLLGRLMGAFKTVSTKEINRVRAKCGEKLWQRNYYEHIVRGETSYLKILEYIETNPLKWKEDRYNREAN